MMIKAATGTPEHTTGTGSSPVLATSAAHGEVGLCVPTSLPRHRRAAAFMTDCSRCNSVPEIPATTEQQL